MNKEQILANALSVLNQQNQPWEVSIEGDSIVARWKWMDATFFAPIEVTNDVKEYKFVVTILDNGKWTEKDYSNEKKANVDFANGKISVGTSSFSGHQVGKSMTIGLGKNNQTGETGIVKFKFETKIVKEPIRQYLTNCGLKKKGLFW